MRNFNKCVLSAYCVSSRRKQITSPNPQQPPKVGKDYAHFKDEETGLKQLNNLL